MVCTPTRRGHPFVPTKGCKNGLGLRPKDPTHRNARPESQSDGFPERGLNGAYKVPQAHLPPPNLPRFGGGERPPFLCKPPAPLTITMGQRLIFRPIAVPRPNPRDPPPSQALTYPEYRTAALHLPAYPDPFPAIGKGGGGIRSRAPPVADEARRRIRSGRKNRANE